MLTLQVIQPTAGDGSLSYAVPSGAEMSLPQPGVQQQIPHPSSSLSQSSISSRLYEESAEYYPPQSTLLVTSLHPTGSRPLRQPVSVIISGNTRSIFA